MKIRIAAAALAVGSLALVGCSSSSNQATTETSPSASAMESMPADSTGTIVDVAASDPKVSTLVTAVQAADLQGTLSGEGPFTVFAPTNEAFKALPPGVLDALLQPENKGTLTEVLTYHVVPGKAMSTDIQPGKVKTVEGQDLTIAVKDDGTVTVNGAKVEAADIEASNGVIHVVDKVLVPPGLDVASLTQ